MNDRSETISKAGYAVNEWCSKVGISRSLFYILPTESKPELTKIGDRTVIFEKPSDWLSRIAKSGGVPSKRSARR